MEGQYRLYLSDIPFSFREDNDVIAFADTLFSHCANGNRLYDRIITSNAGIVYESCITESLSEEDQMQIMKSLSILHSIYGIYYDPDERIFSIKNRLTIQ